MFSSIECCASEQAARDLKFFISAQPGGTNGPKNKN